MKNKLKNNLLELIVSWEACYDDWQSDADYWDGNTQVDPLIKSAARAQAVARVDVYKKCIADIKDLIK